MYILLLLILIPSILIGLGLALDKEWIIGWGAGILAVFLIFNFAGIFGTSIKHVEDLESVEYHQARIEIQKDKLGRLNENLNNFDYPESALMNSDSPVSSIVEEISKAENSIAEAKIAVEKTKRDIRSRKRWIFSYVTNIVE